MFGARIIFGFARRTTEKPLIEAFIVQKIQLKYALNHPFPPTLQDTRYLLQSILLFSKRLGADSKTVIFNFFLLLKIFKVSTNLLSAPPRAVILGFGWKKIAKTGRIEFFLCSILTTSAYLFNDFSQCFPMFCAREVFFYKISCFTGKFGFAFFQDS